MMEEYTREKTKLSELGSFRKKIFEKIYEENKSEIIAKVKDEYNLYMYDDKLAADIFEAGFEVSTNGPGDDEEEQERYTKSRYLLLSLPLPIEKLGKTARKALMGEKDEEKKRQREYETFVHDHVDENLTMDDVKVVKSKESMLDCISQFLKKKETAFENVIVFNGHGADDSSPGGRGLCFAEEEQNMPLDDVLSEIRKISGKFKLGMLSIIFAQCWAHLHSRTADVTVISFTSKNKPTTESIVRLRRHMALFQYTNVLGKVTQCEYLLLSAPLPSREEDEEQRKREFENFMDLLDMRPNPQPEPVVVTNRGLMLGAIRHFLVEGNSQKVIIFNGCGGPKGLYLAERGRDDPLHLDDVIKDVYKEVKKIKQQVQLIFAQSYGHLYTEDAVGGIENFQVIPLTNEQNPNTTSALKRPIPRHASINLVNSNHLQLEEYARQLNDANKQNATSANS